ncbi:hypothetical protein [Cupriavidus sp. CP313]
MLGRMTLEFLNKAKYWLVLGAFLGGSIGYGSAFLVRPQWEATLLLQVGQIAGDEGTNSMVLEPPGRAVDRMRSGPFLEAVIARLQLPNVPDQPSPEADLILKSANVVQMRGSDLLQLSVRGYSEKQAAQFAQGFESELTQVHLAIANPAIERMKEEQASVDHSLTAEQERRADLLKLAQEQLRGDLGRKFSESVVVTQMLAQNDLALRQLERRKRVVKEQLDPARTFNTHALGVPDVSRRPVFPRKSAFAAAGLLAGAIISLVLLLIRWSKRK